MRGLRVPEGDTVWLHAKRLHEALAGQELVLSDFRVPKLATTSLVGRTVLEVVPRGKHLLTRLSGGAHAAHAPADGRDLAHHPARASRGRRRRGRSG